MKLFFAFLLTVVFTTSYAQVTMPDPDWADKQHVAERIAYWHAIETSGPDTNVAEARLRGYSQFISMPRPKGMMIQSVNAWEQVGGSQEGRVSGRPTSIAFYGSAIYLGTSGGGLWKTLDGGNTWVSLSDSWSSYAMGGVAVDQTDGLTIYAATGDLYDRPGDGLYKSSDGGLNWTHTVGSNIIGTQCNQVLIDPLVHTTVYIAGSDGVRRSLDSGMTWKHILNIGGVTSIVIDPVNSQNIYAAGGGIIKKSTDGGNTWSANDLASNISGKATITLGISKADPSKIYASIGSAYNGGSLGIALSTDYGSSWKPYLTLDNYMGQQEFYDNALAVSPNNANNVVVGGLDIFNWTPGSSLHMLTNWNEASYNGNFTHADIHMLTYGPLGLYALTDGGIFFSQNNGVSWQQNKNNKLATMLFVGGDAAPDFSYVLGGAQDNGINRATAIGSAYNQSLFAQTYGGDGGRCFISQEDGGQTAYSTYINATLHKSSGQSGLQWDNGGANLIESAGPDGGALINEQAPFYMTYDVSETDATKVALCGNSNIFYSSDGVNSLYDITTSSISPKAVKAVHVAGADPTVVYAGSSNGNVYVTQNASDNSTTWVKSTTHIGSVSGFVTDPNDASRAWAVVSGYGTNHFWLTTDFGKTWTSPATNLSTNLDASTIARAPNGDLFLGHTFGVMYSKDNGKTWGPLRDGIPLCQITKLRVRGEWLLATTYGRGMYRINISSLPPITNSGVASGIVPNADMPTITSIAPNPVQTNGTVTFKFTLPKEGNASLILFDERGVEVKILAKDYLTQGEKTTQADISGLSSGVYYAVLTSNGYAVTQRLVVAK
jgi:hypothetical protein